MDNDCETEPGNKNLNEKETKNLLSLQLSEIEMLQSIFSKPGELVIDENIVYAANAFINNETPCAPPAINFTIKIDNFNLEVLFTLPSTYPTIKPDFYIASGNITRHQYAQLIKDVDNYIASMTGESCIYSIIMWLQENFLKICSPNEEPSVKSAEIERKLFSRYWIYSHHIYNKVKRKEILESAGTYSISGFCLPGKPGIICIEGAAENCEKWWQIIKSMTWQKITCIKKEEVKMAANVTYDNLRKFNGFCELNFSTSKIHMDMGKLYAYLEEHKCGYIFKDYFGFEGKTSA